jgi:very-short-patch-repair endonuclease
LTWKNRLHPSVSAAEIELFKALSQANLTCGMVTQKLIILKATIPDFMWLQKKLPVYLDGEQVHRKRQEKVSKKASGFSHVDELRSSTELNSSTVV